MGRPQAAHLGANTLWGEAEQLGSPRLLPVPRHMSPFMKTGLAHS